MGWRPRLGVELVEMGAAERELVGEDVGQRHHLGGGVVGEGGGDRSAAVAAAEQAEAYGGVGLIAEGGARLEKKKAAGGSGLEKLSSFMRVHFASHFADDAFEVELFLRKSSICCAPEVSRSMVMAPV